MDETSRRQSYCYCNMQEYIVISCMQETRKLCVKFHIEVAIDLIELSTFTLGPDETMTER